MRHDSHDSDTHHTGRTGARTAATAATAARIAALRNLRGYRIAEGDPDIRGWEVVGGDGQRIGEVNDLLVDTAAGKACYLDIQLDPALYRTGPDPSSPIEGIEGRMDERPQEPTAADVAGAPELDPLADAGMSGVIGHAVVPAPVATPSLVGATTMTEYWVRESISDEENALTAHRHLDNLHHPGERHVAFPVGQAQLDDHQDRVILASQRAEDALNLPAYVPGEISPDYEQGLRKWFDPSFTPSAGQDLYAHDLYDEERFYRGRRASRAETSLPTRGR